MTKTCLLSLHFVLLLFTVQCIWTCCLQSLRTGTEDYGSLARSCFLSLYFVFLLFAVIENWYGGLWKDDKKLFAVIAFCLLVVHSPVYLDLLFSVSENWYGGLWKLDKKLFDVIVVCLLVYSQSMRTGTKDRGRMTRSCFLLLYFVFLLFAVNENRYEGSWKDDKKNGPGKFYYLDSGQVFEGVWVMDTPKCGTMRDFGRDNAPEPTQYPIPPVSGEGHREACGLREFLHIL